MKCCAFERDCGVERERALRARVNIVLRSHSSTLPYFRLVSPFPPVGLGLNLVLGVAPLVNVGSVVWSFSLLSVGAVDGPLSNWYFGFGNPLGGLIKETTISLYLRKFS